MFGTHIAMPDNFRVADDPGAVSSNRAAQWITRTDSALYGLVISLQSQRSRPAPASQSGLPGNQVDYRRAAPYPFGLSDSTIARMSPFSKTGLRRFPDVGCQHPQMAQHPRARRAISAMRLISDLLAPLAAWTAIPAIIDEMNRVWSAASRSRHA